MNELQERCRHCRGLVDAEDIFCANCGADTLPDRAYQPRKSFVSAHTFRCEGCAAFMRYDSSEASLRCPYCGSTARHEEHRGSAVQADAYIPAAIGRDEAEQRLRAWLGRGFWRPSDLASTASISNMRLVYAPYWKYTAKTHTYWTADTDDVPDEAEAEWFPKTGEFRSRYPGILIGASRVLRDEEIAAISDYLLDTLQPLAPGPAGNEPSDPLAGELVEQFVVRRGHARTTARRRIEIEEKNRCEREVGGRLRNVKVNAVLEDFAGVPVLLPIWILSYRYREEVFRFILNAQTGSFHGDNPPISRMKRLLVYVVLPAAAFAVYWALYLR